MKRYIFALLCTLMASMNLSAQDNVNAVAETPDNGKNEIIKKGFNFGPLPVIAFDADKGLQFGALLNVFDFGDGSDYPNTRQSLYLEASFFTKGSQLFVVSYDNKFLIPSVRWSTTAVLLL